MQWPVTCATYLPANGRSTLLHRSPCRCTSHILHLTASKNAHSRTTQHRSSGQRVVASHEDRASGNSVVVVGAGWAGLGASYYLAKQGYKVILVDGAVNPGGLSTGWRTPQGRAVEAGIKGFWKQYHNIFALIKELGIEWPLTPLTRTGFWTPKGLITESPIFSDVPRLPTLLGQFVYTFQSFRTISPLERAALWRMLLPFLEFNTTGEDYLRYDAMSAEELFRGNGVTSALYKDFLEPLLLVLLFAPPGDLSAAAVMSALYYLCMAHQSDFDVAWCRGNIAERIFQPMLQRFSLLGGCVQGRRFVTELDMDAHGRVCGVFTTTPSGEREHYPANAVVLAIGVTGLQKLVQSSTTLSSHTEFRNVMALRAVDVISTRLWLDRKLPFRFASNCIAGFERDVGGTFYHLNELQDEYRNESGSVVAFDLYNTATLMPLSDEQLLQRLLPQLQSVIPEATAAKVVDSVVLRFSKAVTHFSPGSYPYRPQQTTSIPNLFLAGDLVKQVPHGAKGLSQERAYVTGLLAANLVIQQLGAGIPADIIPVEADEPHIAAAREAMRQARSVSAALQWTR